MPLKNRPQMFPSRPTAKELDRKRLSQDNASEKPSNQPTYPIAEVISARFGNALAEKWFALHPAQEIKTIAGWRNQGRNISETRPIGWHAVLTSSFAIIGCDCRKDSQNEYPGTIKKYHHSGTVWRYQGALAPCVMAQSQSLPSPATSFPVIRRKNSAPMAIPKPRKSE